MGSRIYNVTLLHDLRQVNLERLEYSHCRCCLDFLSWQYLGNYILHHLESTALLGLRATSSPVISPFPNFLSRRERRLIGPIHCPEFGSRRASPNTNHEISMWDSNEFISQPNPSPTSSLRLPRSGLSITPSTPWLEIGEIEAEPFLTKFDDLFEELGLHRSTKLPLQKHPVTDHNATDNIEKFTNVNDSTTEWSRHEIEEIMALPPKRPKALSIIHEDHSESPLHLVSTACLSEFEFEFDSFDRPLTEGSMRNATVCVRRDNGKKYIMKRKRAARNAPWSEQTILETLTNSSLPFVSSVYWSFYSGEHIYIVTDHFSNGSLLDLINEHDALGSHQAVFYASELVAAISSLHAMGIMHRDLEPRNILLDGTGHLIITNFGRAEFTSQTTYQLERDASISDIDCAVMGYRAPEILLGWAHDTAADCWSFGMLLHFMLFGMHPFGGRDGIPDDYPWLYDRIVRSSIPTESLRLVHPMVRDLILKCLERNPVMRWDMERIKNHPYFDTIDWKAVFSMTIAAPMLGSPRAQKMPSLRVPDNHRRPLSLNPSSVDDDRQSTNLNSRQENSGKQVSVNNSFQQNCVNMMDLFKPLPRVLDVVQEDEPLSISGTAGHPPDIVCEPRFVEVTAAERISRFWDEIDKEDQGSAPSINSLEFGASTGSPYNNAPKLRKHRSAIQSRNRLFSLSTSSFHTKLRKKPRSTGALREPRPVEIIENLPVGVHQMGSGIGFTYNVPTGVPSKISVCSFAPSCHIFHRGFSALKSGNKTKAKHVTSAPQSRVLNAPSCPPEQIQPNSRPREVGNATFIRDMYRSPSWIVSPPESLPSPLALVNVDSPASGMGPLTPATLVDPADEEDCHVNIVIPKSLELDIDFPYSNWAPGSTLRLVPQTSSECKQPFAESGDNSFCTLATSA